MSGRFTCVLRHSVVEALLIILVVMTSAGLAWAEEGYILDTGDVLRISVFGEPTFPLESNIDDRGAINLPLLGEVKARGLTPAGLAKHIAKSFQEQKLLIEPFVQVDVRQYRPFFISGAVARPGSYPFEPGISVRHALAIAGGFQAQTFSDEVPALKIADLRSERSAFLIDEFRQRTRLARLQAEVREKDSFEPSGDPPLEVAPSLLGEIVKAERQQLAARQSAFRMDLAHLKASLERAKEDAEALASARTERESAANFQLEQLETSRKLQKSGLATNSSLLTAERAQSSYRVELAEAYVKQAGAVQEVLNLESEIRQKTEQRQLALIAEIELEQLQLAKTQSALRYVNDKLLYVSIYGQHRSFDDLRGAVKIMIHRGRAAQARQITADESSEIMAGDVIEVSIEASRQFYDAGAPTVGN